MDSIFVCLDSDKKKKNARESKGPFGLNIWPF